MIICDLNACMQSATDVDKHSDKLIFYFLPDNIGVNFLPKIADSQISHWTKIAELRTTEEKNTLLKSCYD
jgi:hypothetical protein